MMFAKFIRFYNYTAEQALNEYAIRFFALVNSMLRIEGENNLTNLMIVNYGTNGGSETNNLFEQYKKQAGGNNEILQEIRSIKP